MPLEVHLVERSAKVRHASGLRRSAPGPGHHARLPSSRRARTELDRRKRSRAAPRLRSQARHASRRPSPASARPPPSATRDVSLVLNGQDAANAKPSIVPENGRAQVEFLGLDAPYGFSHGEVRIDGADTLPADDHYLLLRRTHRSAQGPVRRRRPPRPRAELYFRAALDSSGDGAFQMERSAPKPPAIANSLSLRLRGAERSRQRSPQTLEDALENYVNAGGSCWSRSAPAAVLPPRAGARRSHPSLELRRPRRRPLPHRHRHRRRPPRAAQRRSLQRREVLSGHPRDADEIARAGQTERRDSAGPRTHTSAKARCWPSPRRSTTSRTICRSTPPGFRSSAQSAALPGRRRRRTARQPRRRFLRRTAHRRQQRRPPPKCSIPTASACSRSKKPPRPAISRSNAKDSSKSRPPAAAAALVAAHADRRESDLAPIPQETLDLWKGTGSVIHTVRRARLAQRMQHDKKPWPLWPYILLLLLGVAVAESVVADGISAAFGDSTGRTVKRRRRHEHARPTESVSARSRKAPALADRFEGRRRRRWESRWAPPSPWS